MKKLNIITITEETWNEWREHNDEKKCRHALLSALHSALKAKSFGFFFILLFLPCFTQSYCFSFALRSGYYIYIHDESLYSDLSISLESFVTLLLFYLIFLPKKKLYVVFHFQNKIGITWSSLLHCRQQRNKWCLFYVLHDKESTKRWDT